MTYTQEVETKKSFTQNAIMKVRGVYYGIREPDSGLVLPLNQRIVKNITLNPSKVDLRKVTQTISSFSIRLSPNKSFTNLMQDDTTILLNETVEIYLGRCNVGMDFSEYLKVNDTKVRSMNYKDGTFNIRTRQAYDIMYREVFNAFTNLTTTIDPAIAVIPIDTTNFTPTGKIKIDEELITYTSIDPSNILGCTRGVDSVASSHIAGAECYQVYELTGNPVDLLLQVLLSQGSGGTYDVLPYGLGVDEALVDIPQIESIRDQFFELEAYDLKFHSIEDTLKELIEPEFLQSLNVRFKTTESQKIGLAILDQAEFSTATKSVGEITISSPPRWEIKQDRVVNIIEAKFDYNVATGKYENTRDYIDQTSIDDFGKSSPLKFKFKGIKSPLGGQAIIADRMTRFLERFKRPTPEINVATHMDKSLYNVGDKVVLTSSELPSASGTLNFSDTLEVVSNGLSSATGTVTFKLAYTSYTGLGSLAYIAPSATITNFTNQSIFEISPGLGDQWETGYVVRLYNRALCKFEDDEPRTIISIIDDVITLDSPWDTAIEIDNHIMRFADHDQVSQAQKTFCFIGQGGELLFPDGSPPYKISL